MEKPETFEESWERMEKDPWNDEVARLIANFAVKGVVISGRDLWRGSRGDEEEFESADRKPKFVQTAKKPHYKVMPAKTESEGPLNITLDLGEGKSVSMRAEPYYQNQKGFPILFFNSMRLFEISLTQTNLSSSEVSEIVNGYDTKLRKQLEPSLSWDLSQKVLLQQTKMKRGKVFSMKTGLATKKGFTLNNTVLEIVPSISAELKSHATRYTLHDSHIFINLEKEQAKEVFYNILRSVEQGKVNK